MPDTSMLYQHKRTGARVKVVTEWEDGDWYMVEDQDGKIFTVYHTEIEQDPNATKKVKSLQVKDAAKGDEQRKFPTDQRLNINGATAQMIADHIKGVGLKTAKDIKELQLSLSGERFNSLEQLRQIPRVDWDSVFAADLVRV